MAELITTAVGYAMGLMHVGLALIALAFFLDRKRFDGWMATLAPHALLAGALLGAGAILMSLYYSEVVGYPVCPLCWWQRIAIYPIAFMFALAWWRNDTRIAPYIYALAAFGALFGLYHAWIQMGGTGLPCAAGPTDIPCDRVYLKELGYITFPVIALTVLAYYSLLAYAAGRKN